MKENVRSRFQSKRALVGWTALLSVLISAAAFLLVVQPQWNRVGVGKELDVEALQNTLEERERYLNQLKALRSNFEKIPATDVDLLSRVLPTDKGIPELLTQLEAIGQQSGVDISDVNISEVAESRASARQQLQQEVAKSQTSAGSKSIKSLNVQIQVTTDRYDRFKQFLESLQTNNRILDVESYLFSTDQEIQTVTLKTYYLPL